MGTSRTTNSAKNSAVSLFFHVAIIILGFFSRKVFVDTLGVELLGLNTTLVNLLGLLNLSEMGISSAIAFTLYKPIAENDREAISEIISVQGWIYFVVACFVVFGAVIVGLFIPQIFADTTVPLSYIYATFGVFLFSSLLGYFFNYKQIIHSAFQQEYKNVLIIKLFALIKGIAQILALKFLSLGYESWLIIEVVIAIMSTFALLRSINKSYPWLCLPALEGRRFVSKHPLIFTKVKQMFFHKLASFALTQASPLIIFAFASLSLVAIYGNYMLIISGIMTLVTAMFGGIIPIVGNMIVEGNKAKEQRLFGEYMVLRMLLGATFAHCLLVGGGNFMVLWMGEDFLLPNFTFYLIVSIGYINMTRPFDTFLQAYGRVEDIWAPIAEAGINLGLSILLGYYFSLPGILMGILISLLVIILGWKSYFLASKGLEIAPFSIISRYFGYTLLFFCVSALLALFDRFYHKEIVREITIWTWGIEMLVQFVLFLIPSILILFAFDINTRNLVYRVASYLKRL